jgi:arylsulfatase A-like enzyme
MTGRTPFHHGIIATLWAHPNEHGVTIPDTMPVLAEVLRKAGFVTAAFDNLFQFHSHPKWFVRGYRHYVDATGPRHPHCSHVRADEVNAEALPWIEAHRNERFFAFIHYWDPHQPYNQPEPYRTMHRDGIEPPAKSDGDGNGYIPRWGRLDRLDQRTRTRIALYDGEITYVDAALGQLVGLLKRVGIYDETLLVLTADHGEDMAEHNDPFSHRELYESTVHVPLIVKPPAAMGHIAPGSEAGALVGHVDLLPTLCEAAEVEWPGDTDGRSLVPLLTGEAEAVRDCVVLTGSYLKTGGAWRSAEIGYRTAGWKVIRHARVHADPGAAPLDVLGLLPAAWHSGERTVERLTEYYNGLPRRELYDLANDPDEVNNLARPRWDIVAELSIKLEKEVCRELLVGGEM